MIKIITSVFNLFVRRLHLLTTPGRWLKIHKVKGISAKHENLLKKVNFLSSPWFVLLFTQNYFLLHFCSFLFPWHSTCRSSSSLPPSTVSFPLILFFFFFPCVIKTNGFGDFQIWILLGRRAVKKVCSNNWSFEANTKPFFFFFLSFKINVSLKLKSTFTTDFNPLTLVQLPSRKGKKKKKIIYTLSFEPFNFNPFHI